MEDNRVTIDGQTLCRGVRLAMSRSEEPILRLLKPDVIRFVAISGLRLVVSWEARLPEPSSQNLAFLIPPLIAGLVSTEGISSLQRIEFLARGQEIVCRLRDHLGQYELRWQSDLSAFPAPEAFGQIIQVPDVLIDVPYLRFSDATHQAVATLAHMESDEQISPSKLAILIDMDFGRLMINGEEIVTARSRQFYFDPRLVIRALEFVREPNLRVGITPLPGDQRAYLSLLAKEGDWLVHCSLLSIGRDTQRLYPLPPGRNR